MGLGDGEGKNCVSRWPSLARLLVDSFNSITSTTYKYEELLHVTYEH